MISPYPSRTSDRRYLQGMIRTTLPQPSPWLVALGILLPFILSYLILTTDEYRVLTGVLISLALLIAIAQPFGGLLIFVGLLYLRPEESIPEIAGMRIALTVSVVTFAALALHLVLHREKLTRSPINLLFLGFGIIAILSAHISGLTSHVAPDIAKNVLLVFLALNLVRSRDRFRIFINTLIILTTYLAIFSVVRYYSGDALLQQGQWERSEATGIFSDPNDLAATIVAGLALTLSRIPGASVRRKFFYLLLSCVLTYAMLLTNSRSGMIAFLVVIMGFAICFSKRKTLAISLAVFMALGFLALGPKRMSNFDSQEASANSRFWFWSNGCMQLMAHPLTGVGYGGFPDVNEGMTAHNSFVLCFAELGFPGYFCWMGSIYYAYRRPSRKDDEEETTTDSYVFGDIQGSRLALSGYLMACFWISRTYVPLMYLLIALPSIQRTAYMEGQSRWNLNFETIFKDFWKISFLCVGSFLFIKILADHFR